MNLNYGRQTSSATSGGTLKSVYETVADRNRNRTLAPGKETRSYSVHRERDSGSVDRIHGHENRGSGFERVIGGKHRDGKLWGRSGGL
jgi:hypothetical protein